MNTTTYYLGWCLSVGFCEHELVVGLDRCLLVVAGYSGVGWLAGVYVGWLGLWFESVFELRLFVLYLLLGLCCLFAGSWFGL